METHLPKLLELGWFLTGSLGPARKLPWSQHLKEKKKTYFFFHLRLIPVGTKLIDFATSLKHFIPKQEVGKKRMRKEETKRMPNI